MNALHDPPAITDGDSGCMLDALRDPACYPHPVRRIEIMETHISWVILTGDHAYKIKKPVNLGFLDFTSLAARRYYCEEELRLNRRFAADIYLGVVAITGDAAAPRVGGGGPAIEYAVKMREFAQADLLSALLARGEVTPELLQSLAARIAAFHSAAHSATMTPGVNTQAGVLQPALDNFKQALPYLRDADDVAALGRLRDWTLREHERHAQCLWQRVADGRVRECHGDLHLANIVMIDGVPTPYDCIEFNPALRWIDVISEVAFLMMDLEAHGRRDLAYAFLNAYLEASGDYSGVAVLPFYLLYRALVRAKINLVRAHQHGVLPAEAARAWTAYRSYLALAISYSRRQRGAIVIMHGLSGSGKTTLTQPALAVLGAIRVRSDVERKRLHGLSALAQTGSASGEGLYTADATARTYARLAQHARSVACAGLTAVVDASFLKREQRALFGALARELDVPFVIVRANAPLDLLRIRIAARLAKGGDASEATLAILEAQAATHEPLSADELSEAIDIDAGNDPASGAAKLSEALRQRLIV